MAFDPTMATVLVEQALQTVIALALRKRAAEVADLAELRALPTLAESGTSLLDEAIVELQPVTGSYVYRWSEFDGGADDGATTIAPTDRTAASRPGRWRRTTSTSGAGYALAVRIYGGEDSAEAWEAKLLAVAPAIMIIFRGENPAKQSHIPGAFYMEPMDFDIRCVSRNLRRGNEALLGSGITVENDADPGVLKLIGDVRKVLAGSDVGLPDDVDFTQVLGHRKFAESLSEGQFVHDLSVRVLATLRFEDAEGEDIAPEDVALTLQPQLVEDDGETLIDINPDEPDQVPSPNP